jgi:hypothetical protein
MKIELTKAQLEAAIFAVGNFTCGDFQDCNGDKRLYAVMQRLEKILREAR